VSDDLIYDVAIVGGGLAGLSLSIQMANQGYKVILLEKEQYPFHRVCGEYISMESWNFLESLGVDLRALHVSNIKRVQLSSVHGRMLQQELPLGGFGISRYRLDHVLANIAKQSGVTLKENTRVNRISYSGTLFSIDSSDDDILAKVAVCGHGKRSNLDIKWKRPFTRAKKNKLNNYIGVKYHIRYDFPIDSIALHNFKNGYCGIVKVEDDKYCLCYLTTAANLQICSGDIKKMEQSILSVNPHLKKILADCEMLWEAPVIISQISFDKKTQIEDHVLMIGDATGMITPLCGNGMSMALHASKIAAEQVGLFLQGTITRKDMEENYITHWKKLFAGRMRTGRIMQRLFNNSWLTGSVILLGKKMPGLIRMLIRKTHGRSF
jgi:flavin-dependent dehydrogenase